MAETTESAQVAAPSQIAPGNDHHGRYHALSSVWEKRGLWLGVVAYAVAAGMRREERG